MTAHCHLSILPSYSNHTTRATSDRVQSSSPLLRQSRILSQTLRNRPQPPRRTRTARPRSHTTRQPRCSLPNQFLDQIQLKLRHASLRRNKDGSAQAGPAVRETKSRPLLPPTTILTKYPVQRRRCLRKDFAAKRLHQRVPLTHNATTCSSLTRDQIFPNSLVRRLATSCPPADR